MGCSLEEKNLNCNRFKLILKTNYFSPHSALIPFLCYFMNIQNLNLKSKIRHLIKENVISHLSCKQLKVFSLMTQIDKRMIKIDKRMTKIDNRMLLTDKKMVLIEKRMRSIDERYVSIEKRMYHY